MAYYFNFIIYIIYSFLFLFCSYICLLIYKKYSYALFNIFNIFNNKIKTNKIISEIITSEKNSDNYKRYKILNPSKKIKKIKSQYKIKSSEKTFEEIKFITQKPNYINLSDNNTYKCVLENIIGLDKIINYNEDEQIQKITKVYLKTKQEFIYQFVNSETNEYYINNINNFGLYHKNNLSNNSNANILIKFYNGNGLGIGINSQEYKYIFVNQYKMIKIINNSEYDDICNMIEKNNGIFMLEDKNGNNIIGYGSYSQSDVNPSSIKKIFFSNNLCYETNKNYKLLCEYTSIKIYFYICNSI